MQVRTGDLAYVLSSATTPGLAGRFVIVGVQAPSGAVIKVDGAFFEGRYGSFICQAADGGLLPTKVSGNVKRRPIATHILRPIRDPGDDAQDETLTWKDVPKTEDVWPDPATMQWDDTDKTWTP